MKYRLNFLVLLIICMTSMGYAENDQHQWNITHYKLFLNIQQTSQHLDIRAYLALEFKGKIDTLKIQLAEGFRGTAATDLQVFDDENNPLAFTYADSIISLHPVKPWKQIEIDYTLEKDPNNPTGRYMEFGREFSDSLFHINPSLTSTDNWYPRPYGRLADRLPGYDLYFDYPANFELVASGHMVNSSINQGRTCSHWVNYPEITDRSLFFFAQTNCKRVVKEYDDFTVYLYVPTESLNKSIDYVADYTNKCYHYYENKYGKATGKEFKVYAFPYDYASGLNFCCVPISFFTKEIKVSEIGYPIRTMGHEISHTWWGNVISMIPHDDYWLAEGFAKFSEVDAIDDVIGLPSEKFIFSRTRTVSLPYIDFTHSIQRSAEDQDPLLPVSAYYQGALVLNYIRWIIGEDQFNSFLHNYIETYRNQCISTKEMLSILEKQTDKQTASLASDYVMNPGFAGYLVKEPTFNKKKNLITWEISNPGDKPIISDLFIKTDSDSLRKRLDLPKGAKTSISLHGDMKKSKPIFKIDEMDTFPMKEYNLKSVGSLVAAWPDGSQRFNAITPGSPPQKAGMNSNTAVLKINGEDVTTKTIEELTQLFLQPTGTRMHILIKELDTGKEKEVVIKY